MLKLMGGNFSSIFTYCIPFFKHIFLFCCNNFLQCGAILTLFFFQFSSEHYFAFKQCAFAMLSLLITYVITIFKCS